MLKNMWELEEEDFTTPLGDIFSEEPPTLETFLHDANYLDKPSVKLGDEQYQFVRHFEQILLPPTYVQMVEEFGEYWNPVRFCNEYAIEWGKGSGKDFCCQVCFARLSNILLCLKNPQEYFDLDPDTYIHMLNVAASAPQAHSVFFKPLRATITRSKWFKDKFEGEEPGPQATEIRFKKQIELISGHSQASTLEGKNLVAGIADEISEFPTEEEVQVSRSGRVPAKTAKAILEMLKTSGSTRFPETYRLAQISFPRYKGDAIEQAVAKGRLDNEKQGQKSRSWVSGPMATWYVNPRYDKYEKIEIPGATQLVPNLPVFIDDYENDPAAARAKYECKPELAESRFFANDAMIFQSFADPIVSPIEFVYYWGYDEKGIPSEVSGVGPDSTVMGWQVKFIFQDDFRPMMGAIYAMHGDLAIKGDRAGVAMAHVRNVEKRDWRVPGGAFLEQRPIVKIDYVGAFEADATARLPNGELAPREVQIRWYRKLIWQLRTRGFQINYVSFDNFQSTDSMQILESWGIETCKASTDIRPDLYNNLRDVMYDGRLEGYQHELLIDEIRRLSKLRNGMIDHPPAGSKDLADAVAGAVDGAVKMGGSEGDEPVYADQLEALSLDPFLDQRTVGAEYMLQPADFGGGTNLSAGEFGF